MGRVDFSGLEYKLIGSIVAISAIELLKAFVKVTALTREQLMWKVIIHVVLVSSGLLFAVMDRIAEGTGQEKQAKRQVASVPAPVLRARSVPLAWAMGSTYLAWPNGCSIEGPAFCW